MVKERIRAEARNILFMARLCREVPGREGARGLAMCSYLYLYQQTPDLGYAGLERLTRFQGLLHQACFAFLRELGAHVVDDPVR